MKSSYLMLAAISVAAAVSSNAQGVLNFSNGAAGVDAPVKNSSGVNVATDGVIVAQLFAGPQGAAEGSLVAVGAPISFSLAPGYFFGGTLAIPSVAGGSVATVQVRTWTASAGSYAAAMTTPGAQYGQSGLVNVTVVVNGGATPTPNIVGLTGFTMTLTPVPEPSTIALAGLGLGGLLLARRKKA